MKHEIAHMLQGIGGAIVNNASIAGMIAEPGISAYIAAKHRVVGLSKAAAVRRIRKSGYSHQRAGAWTGEYCNDQGLA